MSTHEHDHEMFLHALRSAADSIQPRSDGLDQIRSRLRHRPYPLPVAWLAAAWMQLTMRVTEGASSAGRQVSDKLRLASAGAHSAGRQVARKLHWAYTEEIPADGKVGEKLRTISQWFVSELPEPVADARAGKSSAWSLLRPLAAFGVAVFIVAVGAYAAIRIPAIGSTPSGNSQQQGADHGGSPNGPNSLNGGSSSPFPSPGSIVWPTPSNSSRTAPAWCITKPGPSGGSPSATPTGSQGQSASPSPTSPAPSSPNSSTPPPTATPTPTPTYSQSPGGGGQPTPGASAGVARTTTDVVILPAKAAAPSVHTSKSPCSTPSPKKTKKQPANGRPSATRSPALGGLFPAKPARHQSNRSA